MNEKMDKKANNSKKISALRKKIDKVDDEILVILNQRLELACQIGKYKTSLRDFQREVEVKERVKIKAKQLRNLREDFVLKLYSLIIKESLFLQRRKETYHKEVKGKFTNLI